MRIIRKIEKRRTLNQRLLKFRNISCLFRKQFSEYKAKKYHITHVKKIFRYPFTNFLIIGKLANTGTWRSIPFIPIL